MAMLRSAALSQLAPGARTAGYSITTKRKMCSYWGVWAENLSFYKFDEIGNKSKAFWESPETWFSCIGQTAMFIFAVNLGMDRANQKERRIAINGGEKGNGMKHQRVKKEQA